MAKLLVHESAGIREFEIIDNEVHMGRELDNTLRLPDPSISRHHCVLRQVGGGFEIQDLQSSNGVLVNGNRVQSSPLHDGDRITVGQVHLTFVDPRSEVGATIGLNILDAPALPSGTIRMSAEQLAAIHQRRPPSLPESEIQPQEQFATGPVQASTKPPVPPTSPPGVESALLNGPATPSFLGPLLPPIPDDAVPTGERGDFITRLLAALIDYSPLFALQVVSILLMPTSLDVGSLGADFGAIAAVGCISLLLFFAYLFFIPWCWINFGATPGKKIMKLRVVPESDPTGRIDLGMAVLRMLGYLVNGLIAWIITLPFTAFFMVGAMRTGVFGGHLFLMKAVSLVANLVPYLLILFTAERKGLHDMISKTVVIKVDR
jgi:uncharacterized RDD family membrane protein YckC